MSQSLLDRVQKIWNQKFNEHQTNDISLQVIADIIKKWKRLLPPCYEQVELNSESCSRELSDALGWVSRTLALYGFYGAATQFLIDAWKETGKRQQKARRKVYRAAIAFYLSEIYIRRGDRGAAFWWQLHALADDYLEGGIGGGAKIVLESILGIPKGLLLDNLRAIAIDHRNVCEQSNWKTQEGFAENVVVRFAIAYPEWASVFAYPTNEVEFPVSPGYLSYLLENLDKGDKGKNLEFVACYLFLHIPGCTPTHNLTDLQQTWQTDAIIRNLTPQSNLVAETFGRHFAIECKNWAKRVGSPECGYFLQRIRLMHFSFGVMLAKDGITGNPKGKKDETAARQLIRRTFHENGTLCIVLSQKHLEALRDENTTLWAMLLKEIEEFRFGRT
jgi:hypothetical protein